MNALTPRTTVSTRASAMATGLACALLGIGSAAAQDLVHKAPPQDMPIALINAHIHTVAPSAEHPQGRIIERGWVLFENGRITDVGSGDRAFMATARVVDLQGKRVYPGMIAAVTQVGLSEHAAVAATVDIRETGDVKPEARAIVAVNPDSTLIPVLRSAGVLSVGVFPQGGPVAGVAGVMQLDGWTWESMAVAKEAGLVIEWPNVRPVRAWWMDQSPEDQGRDITRRLERIDEVFASAEAYFRARVSDPGQRQDIRYEAMRPFMPQNEHNQRPGMRQRPVFIFAQELDQITSAVSWAVGRKLKPVIIGGRDAWLCAELLKQHDVGVIVQGTHTQPRRDDSPYDEPFTLPNRLEQAGVRWALTGGEEPAHERNLPHHAGTAVAHGLSEHAAIRSITRAPAELLGVGEELGSIEPGKRATLIITDGSPLDIRTRVHRAFIDGRDIDLSNKQEALAEKYRAKYKQMSQQPGGPSR